MRNSQTRIQNILSIEGCQMKGHLSAHASVADAVAW